MAAYTKDEIYNTVEMILKRYYTYRAQARLDKEELTELFAKGVAGYSGMPHGSEVGNQTLDLVERRNEPTINMKKARAIEIIFESLTEELQVFCKMYFFEQKSRAVTMDNLHIETKKFYSLKNAIIGRYREMLPWRTFGENKNDMATKWVQKGNVMENKPA